MPNKFESTEEQTGDGSASTERYGLSHIQDFLEKDDDAAGEEESSFSFSELVAYRAKASELAAIVKEDSPALSFKLNFETSWVSEEHQHRGHLQYPSYQLPNRSFLPVNNQVAESSQKKLLWMNSLGFPQSLAVPPSSMSNKFLSNKLLNTALFKNLLAGEEDPPFVDASRQDRDYALKPQKDQSKQKGIAKTRTPYAYVDLNNLLLRCAYAIGSNNTRTAMELLLKVKQHASPYGDGVQRMAHYFVEALHARLAGTGWQIYCGYMQHLHASAKEILKATCMYVSSCPFAKASRYFVNQTILDVAKGASTLHIIEFQLTGFQYPSLFKALAARPGGPPLVRLIGSNVPHHSRVSHQTEVVLNMLEQTGRKLTACAALYGVPFHFTAWAGNTEDFVMQDYVSPNRSADEALVILSIYPLHYTYDDLLNPPEKRLGIFKTILAMKPEAYIHGFVTGSYNTPIFSHRVRAALFHFESQYNMLDTFIDGGTRDRIVFESEILGKAVLDIVACEKTNVVERVHKHKQWYAVAKAAGLKQIPLNQEIEQEVWKILKSWHKDYMVAQDLNYLLMGWKGRILHALAAWKG